MKSLDFEMRSLVAKECIKRVCEAAGLKTTSNNNTDKTGKICDKVASMLADAPNMGKLVVLSTSTWFWILLTLTFFAYKQIKPASMLIYRSRVATCTCV